MKTRTIVIWALVVLAAVLVIQNSQLSVLRMLFWHIYAPQFILVVILFFLGFSAGWLAGRRGRNERAPKAAPPAPPAMPPAQPAKKP
jgi:uncharacterized SAM-binding protein YcdF (DUF218 family)